MELDREFYLSLAIDEAWKYQILTFPNPAVGCTVVSKTGELLAVEAHKKAGMAHAELEATKVALKKINQNLIFPEQPKDLYEFILLNHNNLLKDSTYYVTLEPCSHVGKTPSCAKLLSQLGIKKVVIGSLEKNKLACGGVQILKNLNIEIETNVCEQKCNELLEPFTCWSDSHFSFFKIALRLDGSYDNGLITSVKSRQYVHRLRDVCDLIVVGGSTVRIDKPTLDSRLVSGKAPDVLIVTNKSIDKTISLFHVKNRDVIISNVMTFPLGYKNIMIEGGNSLLELAKDKVDWFLIFHNSSFSTLGNSFIHNDLNLQLMHMGSIENDIFGWYKKIK